MGSVFDWFFAFMLRILDGFKKIFVGLFDGVVQIFNVPAYIEQFKNFKGSFTVVDWILAVLLLLLVLAVFAILTALIVLGIRRLIHMHHTDVGKEDLLDELANLHRDVVRLTSEKEKIMALKLEQTSISAAEISEIFRQSAEQAAIEANGGALSQYTAEGAGAEKAATAKDDGDVKPPSTGRFYRLNAVDDKYRFYVPPTYRTDLSLKDICDEFRNFACSKLHLYYDEKTIRLMFAGLSSTKLIILQGISGTGKTSLPYAMGKFFANPATIASVQPSWRDRNELFGYFNEFTKHYNETEFLRRVYEAGYNDDINIIILDEMNIARVEYYFAEMLSIMEMPDNNEWKLELVPSSWPDDPKNLADGILHISPNIWYIGTANNDDSTFSVSDKVYDRALVINLDSKGQPFEAPEIEPQHISYSYVDGLYQKAIEENPVSAEVLEKLNQLDLYVIEKFRVAFGNRIVKQLRTFVPVYAAAGGTELGGIDYILATKIFRKFEALNLSLIRDEIDGLIDKLNDTFGQDEMEESIKYLTRLKKMY